jgi:hypothetical protein
MLQQVPAEGSETIFTFTAENSGRPSSNWPMAKRMALASGGILSAGIPMREASMPAWPSKLLINPGWSLEIWLPG